MSLTIRSQPQDENAHAVRMGPVKTGGLGGSSSLSRGGLGSSAPLKPTQQQQQRSAMTPVLKGGLSLEPRRALGDITNSNKQPGGSSSGSLKLQPTKAPLPSPAPAPASRLPKSKPIVAVLPSITSATAASSSSSLDDPLWREVDVPSGPALALVDDEDELGAETARTVQRAFAGRAFRPASPIPWEKKSAEELAHNAVLADVGAMDFSSLIDDFDLGF